MRPGDRLTLFAIGLTIGLTLLDGLTGGGVAAWAQANLAGIARTAGLWLGRAGLYLSPLLLVPLLAGLAGRFAALPTPVWSLHRRLIAIIDTVTTTVGGAARWFALGLVVVTAVIVIQRYVFGYASTKLQESVIYMHALLFLLASASALLNGGHVRVDVLFARAGERGKAWTDLLGTYLALMPMSLLILWSSTGYMSSTWRILERSRESDGLPFVFLLKTAIPVFAVLMILQGLSMAARAAMTIGGQKAPDVPDAFKGEV
ncbi:TRAP transporter small permease subunit [Maricaulis sp.]|uniref:TRAP transporter small permease subunit n=1 Tax=Maricaulis sp. TaxID=1486257 RepID=UPI00261FBFB7|nr:TRAP transporter small permease subunit [Maricaulis sp.]